MSSRRDFVKRSCLTCMGLISTGSLWSSCSSALPVFRAVTKGNDIHIDRTEFSRSRDSMMIIRSQELENDILLLKDEEGFRALNMKCTHEGIPLTPTKDKLYCNAHGSVFDMKGRVLAEPALKPLEQFETSVNEQLIVIHIN